MNLSTRILGSTAVKQLQVTSNATVLQVGKDALTRSELAQVGCYNFHAARNLSAVLAETAITSLQELYNTIPPSALALPHMGVISLAVLGAAFEARSIGGEAPLESWVRLHRPGNGKDPKDSMVTFHTLKKREAAEVARERKARRSRRRRQTT